jgi:pimeloyl-ACP methyl ester carboxylesterase
MRNAASEIRRAGREAWLETMKERVGDAWTLLDEKKWRASDVEALLALLLWRRSEGLEGAARQMSVPCLIYAGEEDGLTYDAVRATADFVPGARSFWLPGLDHVEAIHRSDLVVPHVREFLAQVEARR